MIAGGMRVRGLSRAVTRIRRTARGAAMSLGRRALRVVADARVRMRAAAGGMAR